MLELIAASIFSIAPVQVTQSHLAFESILVQEKSSEDIKGFCLAVLGKECSTSVKLLCNVKTDFELNIKSFDRCETPFTPVSGYFYLDGSYEVVLPNGTIYKGTRK